jgi:Flp pilus assembly protein TadG
MMAMMIKRTRRLIRDEHGSVLVEVSVMIPIIFIFVLGLVDFLNAFQQWNASTKAVEVGARLAAVSDPVVTGMTSQTSGQTNMATAAVTGTVGAGDPMPDFEVTCDGFTATCTCTRGTCTGMGSYSATAMNTLLYGRGKTACSTTTTYYFAGMCNFLGSITAANVKVIYSQTGLGYAGRGDGPVPTVTVKLKSNLPFKFFFLGGLMSFADINIPSQSTTITGEALSSAAQS